MVKLLDTIVLKDMKFVAISPDNTHIMSSSSFKSSFLEWIESEYSLRRGREESRGENRALVLPLSLSGPPKMPLREKLLIIDRPPWLCVCVCAGPYGLSTGRTLRVDV